MNLSHSPNLVFANRRSGSGVAEQILQQGFEVDACVEAVGEGPEVVAGVFAELEGLVSAVDGRPGLNT